MGVVAILVMWHGSFELLFPQPIEAAHEICLRLAQQFWRRYLKMVDDDRACLYYKLAHEPKGSGELTISL